GLIDEHAAAFRIPGIHYLYDARGLFKCTLPFARGKDEADEVGACVNCVFGIFQCLHAANFHCSHFFTFSSLITSAGLPAFINVSPTSRHSAFPSAISTASSAVCMPLSAMKRILSS